MTSIEIKMNRLVEEVLTEMNPEAKIFSVTEGPLAGGVVRIIIQWPAIESFVIKICLPLENHIIKKEMERQILTKLEGH
jgi:hypothetical protein